MIPIKIGEIIVPNKMPNFVQYIFKGVNKLEWVSPRMRKIREIIIAQYLISSPYNVGYNPINTKTIKKTDPKLLLLDKL